MEKDILILEEDFDLTIPYPLGKILYSSTNKLTDTTIKTWIVTGHQLLNSSEYRKMTCVLMSYPISVFVKNVEHTNTTTAGLQIFESFDAALEYKKSLAYQNYIKTINDLNQNTENE